MSIIRFREKVSRNMMYVFAGGICLTLLAGIFYSFAGPNMQVGSSPDSRQIGGPAFEINGRVYNSRDFEAQFNDIAQRMQGQGITQMAMLRGQMVDFYVTQAKLAEAARSAGIKVSGREINDERKRVADQELESLKSQLFGAEADKKTDADLDQALVRQTGKGLNTFRKQFEARQSKEFWETALLARKYEETVRSKVQVTEEDLKNSYRTLTVDHILVSFEGRPEATARKRAEDILAKAKGGEDFASLAKEFSDDLGTKREGGRVPSFQAGASTGDPVTSQFGEDFVKAAAGLKKPGDLSEPVKTPNGLSIIKLAKADINLPKDFEKNKADLLKDLQRRESDPIWQEAVKKVQEETQVKFINPEFEGFYLLSQFDPKTGEVSKENLEKAEAKFKEHIKQAQIEDAPYDITLLQLAQVQERLGKNKDAAVSLEEFFTRNEDAQVRLTLARLYMGLKDKDKALQHYKEASLVTIDPNVHFQLMQVFTNELPNQELAAKSQKIVEDAQRQYQEQMRMQQQAKEEQERKSQTPAQGGPEEKDGE